MQRPSRLDLSFGWCGASHGAQQASAEAALNAAQGMQFKTPLAEAFIRKHHYLHQGNRAPPWHGPCPGIKYLKVGTAPMATVTATVARSRRKA